MMSDSRRRPLSKRTRFEVFKRDGFRCTYCGKRPPEVVLVIDHVVPVAEGGGDEPENLTTACYACNAGKGAVPLGDVLPSLDELGVLEALQEVAERRLLLKQQAASVDRRRQELDAVIEQVRGWWVDETDRPDAFEAASVKTFLQQGLSLDEIEQGIRAAARKVSEKHWIRDEYLWRYFCGACWRMLREERLD